MFTMKLVFNYLRCILEVCKPDRGCSTGEIVLIVEQPTKQAHVQLDISINIENIRYMLQNILFNMLLHATYLNKLENHMYSHVRNTGSLQ